MKPRHPLWRLVPWTLAGAVVASVWLNVGLLRRVDALESRLQTRPANSVDLRDCRVEVPEALARRLGLSREQCAQIEGCSIT